MTTPDQDTTAQRSATRAPVGKPIKLQFDDSMDVVEGLCENVSIGGMFIQVGNTRPQGSLVRFELQLDDSTAVRGLGEVVWMRAKSAGAGRSAGIGIKFRFLEQRDRQLIFKLVSQHIKDRLANRQSQGNAGSRTAPPPAATSVPALPPAASPPPPAASPPPPAVAPAATLPPSRPAAPLLASGVPPELLAVADEPTAVSEVPGEPSIPEPSIPELSIPEPPISGPPIREPEVAAAEVLEPGVDDPEIPELLMVPEEEEEPVVELVEDFDTELEGLEAAPALAESVPDLPRSGSKDEETLSELTLTPGLEEEISYDEMMGRDVTGTGAPDFAVPDVGAWGAGMPDHGLPDHGVSEPGLPDAGVPDAGVPDHGIPDHGVPEAGVPDHGVPDHGVPDRGGLGSGLPDAGMPDHGLPDLGLSDSGGWETVAEAGVEPGGEGLTEEDFGPSRRRSPLFLVLAAVLAAGAVAVYFFRDDLFGGGPAPAARTAVTSPAPVEGTAEVPPGGDPAAAPPPSTAVAEPTDEAPSPAAEPVTSPTAGEPPVVAVAPPSAAPPEERPAAVEPPPADTPAATPFTRVTDISWGPLTGGQRVVIAADGAVPQGRYKYSRLDSPPRELIKLYGVRQPFAKTALTVGGPAVQRIRLGYHPGNELHIVLDLADPQARIREVRSVGSRLVVELEVP